MISMTAIRVKCTPMLLYINEGTLFSLDGLVAVPHLQRERSNQTAEKACANFITILVELMKNMGTICAYV